MRGRSDTRPAEEVKILVLHGVLHLRGYDHECDNGRMARREKQLRAKLHLPLGLIETRADDDSARREKAPTMIGVGIALALLFGLLTLVSYVDRLYQEIGKFLSRDFQDNIDAFEQIVEPRLRVTRARASLSMAILTQLVTAAIAMIVGFTVFRDRAWSVYEVLEATLSLVLIIIFFNRLLPFVFFSRTRDAGWRTGRCSCAC